jgi:predicted Fe-S protein YdhL (DUF1289 family)
MIEQADDSSRETRLRCREDFDPREVVRNVLSRINRVNFLGLSDEERQALLTELRERGHDDVAARIEKLEVDIARMATRKRTQKREQEQELGINEQISRAIKK